MGKDFNYISLRKNIFSKVAYPPFSIELLVLPTKSYHYSVLALRTMHLFITLRDQKSGSTKWGNEGVKIFRYWKLLGQNSVSQKMYR